MKSSLNAGGDTWPFSLASCQLYRTAHIKQETLATNPKLQPAANSMKLSTNSDITMVSSKKLCTKNFKSITQFVKTKLNLTLQSSTYTPANLTFLRKILNPKRKEKNWIQKEKDILSNTKKKEYLHNNFVLMGKPIAFLKRKTCANITQITSHALTEIAKSNKMIIKKDSFGKCLKWNCKDCRF